MTNSAEDAVFDTGSSSHNMLWFRHDEGASHPLHYESTASWLRKSACTSGSTQIFRLLTRHRGGAWFRYDEGASHSLHYESLVPFLESSNNRDSLRPEQRPNGTGRVRTLVNVGSGPFSTFTIYALYRVRRPDRPFVYVARPTGGVTTPPVGDFTCSRATAYEYVTRWAFA